MPERHSILRGIAVWARMVKFSHSVFALPFAFIGAFLAGENLPGRKTPYLGQIGLILICMVAGRSVAMTFNRIVDRQIDARNPRTASRPLPVGAITLRAAFAMLILSAATFGIGCLGFAIFYQNTWPILLSGPVLAYLCAYSFTKRFTKWSHIYLGSAIAIAPLAAWLAIHPASFGLPAVILAIAVACWITGFDIIYACQDIAVDVAEGLHSLPSRMGAAKALWIARFAHAVAAAALIFLGVIVPMGPIYAAGVAIAIALLVVENLLVKANDFRYVNVAFFTVNGMVSIVLAVAALTDILTRNPA